MALAGAIMVVIAACGSSDPDETEDVDVDTDVGVEEEEEEEEDEPDAASDADGMGALSSRPIRMIGQEPTQGFDPGIARANASTSRMGWMFATLVERDQDGEIVGALAESWDMSDDGLVWTFGLRDTARFSDGSQVTADDVVWTMDYLLASEAMGGSFPDIAEVRSADESTVEFELAEPAGRLLLQALMRPGSAGIISAAAVEAAGGPDDYFLNPAVTSGPFTMEEYLPGDSLTLGANEYFWREGYPKSQGIELRFSEDPSVIQVALLGGEIDIANMRAAESEALLDSPDFELFVGDELTPTFWGLDRTQPPFDSQEVRQAIAYAVSRDVPREACWFGIGGTTYGSVLRDWDPFYVELSPFDLPEEERFEIARELLEGAGWVDDGSGVRVADGVEGEDDGTPFSVTVPYEASWPESECHTLILSETMAKIGIEIVPDQYDPASFWSDVADNQFRMWHGGASAPEGEAFLRDWLHSGGFLTPLSTKLDDPEIDAMVDEALTTPEREVTAGIIEDFEEWMIDFVPMVVIGYQNIATFAPPEVNGFWKPVDPLNDARPLSEISIDE